jgi:hypothetical protein
MMMLEACMFTRYHLTGVLDCVASLGWNVGSMRRVTLLALRQDH